MRQVKDRLGSLFGGPEHRAEKVLESAGSDNPSGREYVHLQVKGTQLDQQYNASRRIRRMLRTLNSATAELARRDSKRRREVADDTRRDRLLESKRKNAELLAENVPITRHVLSVRAVHCMVLLLFGSEFIVSHQLFSGDVDARVGLLSLERAAPILLALLPPTTTVAVGQLSGTLLQRWFRARDSNQEKAIPQRIAAGAVTGLVLAATSCLGTTWMVAWRFGDEGQVLGSRPLPSTALAVIFATLNLLMVAIFAFGVSEEGLVRTERDRKVRSDQRRLAMLSDAVIPAAEVHRNRIDAIRLDRAGLKIAQQQVEVTGRALISRHDATVSAGGPTPTATAATDVRRFSSDGQPSALPATELLDDTLLRNADGTLLPVTGAGDLVQELLRNEPVHTSDRPHSAVNGYARNGSVGLDLAHADHGIES